MPYLAIILFRRASADRFWRSNSRNTSDPTKTISAARALLRESITDQTLGIGLSVTGFVDPSQRSMLLSSSFLGHGGASLSSIYEAAGDIPITLELAGLDSTVVMAGFQRNVSEWLRACDAFVLCSLNEGTSVSLIESMAAGLPSVATRVGGNPYVVQEGVTGLLVPSQDAEGLAQAMLSLARDPERGRTMGAAAIRSYEDRFLPSEMDRTYDGMYRRALGIG